MRRSPALALYAVFAYLFLHLPLLILAAFSFNSSRFTVWEGFSLDWYRSAFQDAALAETARNSLIIAVAATALSTIIGTNMCLWTLEAPLARPRKFALSLLGNA